MKKTSIALVSIFLTLSGASLALASFSDVPNTNPFYTAINYVHSQGIVSGYPDGTYKPDQLVNRAEFVKIMVGSALNYNPSQDPSGYDIYALVGINLSDINSGDWFVPYVRKALQNDIIAGYPDGTFRGANNINKAEAAKIITKSFPIPTLDTSFNFNWFDNYIYALELVNAVPTSLACLDQNVTRGELAEMIYRVKTNLTTLPSAKSYNKTATKLIYNGTSSKCNAKGFTLPATSTTSASTDAPKQVTLDDSDVNNGSTMYDFDTEQRTNSNVTPDMMLGSIFYESSWMHGVDWQVVPMTGTFDSISECPATGYASVHDVGPDGFGTPYNAWQGDIYCLKTSEGKYVLLEVLSAYNEGDNRFLTFRYLMNRSGGTKIRSSIAFGSPFKLKVNQTATLPTNSAKITFSGVASDPRCPSGVQCIWAGEAKLNLSLEGLQTVEQTVLPVSITTLQNKLQLKDSGTGTYTLELNDLAPYPNSQTTTSPTDYEATFTLTKTA